MRRLMLRSDVKMALESIASSKVHSFLTMFGIVVGVSSVVTMVSLGLGFKGQVRSQVEQVGSETITVRPGRLVNRDGQGRVTGLKFFSAGIGSSISGKEFEIIRSTPGVDLAVPFAMVTGSPTIEGQTYDQGGIIGTTDNAPSMLNRKVQDGSFFGPEDAQKNVAVLGRFVADELFKEQAPIGKAILLRGQRYIVGGVFEEFPVVNFNLGVDFNRTVFVSLGSAKALNSATEAPIFQVLVRPASSASSEMVATAISSRLKEDRAGQEDFTVLSGSENLSLTNNILSLATVLVTSVASISLLVGGIGIMNIMFAFVTERTGEIGVRKALGATNQQILAQFLAEAVVLSLVGGLVGILFSLIANGALRILTDIKPELNIWVLLGATCVSVLVGVLSGIIPAARAARKDPIQALKYN